MKLPPLSSLLSKQTIKISSSAKTIPDVIDEITDLLCSALRSKIDRNEIREALIARETVHSTAIGYECALPHASVSGIDAAAGCIIISKAGVPFGSLDGKSVRIFFCLIIPALMVAERAELVKSVFTLLMEQDFRDSLLTAQKEADILRAVRTYEGAS